MAGSLASRAETAWGFWHSDDKTELAPVARGVIQDVVEAVKTASDPYPEAESAMSAVWRHFLYECKASNAW